LYEAASNRFVALGIDFLHRVRVTNVERRDSLEADRRSVRQDVDAFDLASDAKKNGLRSLGW